MRYLAIYLLLIQILSCLTQEICKPPVNCSCDSVKRTVDCSSKNIAKFQFNNTNLWVDPSTNKTLDFDELNFYNNSLLHVGKFSKLSIKKLILTSNRITQIQLRAFQHLQFMEELDLTDNSLMSDYFDPDIFEGEYEPEDDEPMQSLKILRLGKNSLHTLKPDIFKHTDRLEVLMLDSNPLTIIDKSTAIAISTLQHLKVLDLSYTNIKTLPSFFMARANSLFTLNLTGNEMERLPVLALSNMQQLEWLSISDNEIENLGGKNVFPKMKSLKTLHMCQMSKLRFIGPSSLSGLHKLEVLKINHNDRFSYMDKDSLMYRKNATNYRQRSYPILKHLELNNNNLTHLNINLFGLWGRLEYLDVTNNPWVCSCDNQWMIEELVPLINNFENKDLINNFKCAEPYEMYGHKFSALYDDKVVLKCIEPSDSHDDRDASILMGILIGILVTIPGMMALLLFCAKRHFFGYITTTRGPAAYTRTFYNRAEIVDDRYI